MPKKNNDTTIEAHIRIDGQAFVAAPGKHCADIDQLLENNGAHSFVFIPLVKLKGKKGPRPSRAKTLRRRKTLPGGDWFDGELRDAENGETVPGVLGFDVRRSDARAIAEKLGVKQFVWGAHGAPVEEHFTKILDDDEVYSWGEARRRALFGLMDMYDTAANMRQLPQAVEESQTTMQRFKQLAYLVLGVALAAGLLQGVLLGREGWLATLTLIAFYPPIMPAVFVGVYLRALMRKAESQGRDFTAGEAEDNWVLVAPHLLALWALCYLAVLILTWLQTLPNAEVGILGDTDGISTSFIICVWMLLPIAQSRDFNSLVSSAFESGINALLSIFMIKLTLFLTNLLNDALWSLVASLVPFDIPEVLQRVISAIINIGAEIFFLAVLLGYAWSRTRQQFMRL